MKSILIAITCCLTLGANVNEPTNTSKKMNFYDFTVQDINGDSFDFESLKGKRVMIVNTASKCGYTPQYKELQELYDTYGGDSFEIIGFPCNDFGGQEPGSEEDIASFCQKNFGVSFPMMSKVGIKKDTSPIYSWLTNEDENGKGSGNVKWNFHKFLIDENGNWVKELSSGVSPLSEEVIAFAQGK